MSDATTFYAKISTITSEVGNVPVTGNNQYHKPAHSISDVESALKPLFVKHGVVPIWQTLSIELIDKNLWVAKMACRWFTVENSGVVPPQIEDPWSDSGSNPSAAMSFARKSYYKALFHIADTSDEGDGLGSVQSPGHVSDEEVAFDQLSSEPPQSPVGKAVAAAAPHLPTGGPTKITEVIATGMPPSEGDPCPVCGTGFLKTRLGKYGSFFGCSNYPKCKGPKGARQ